MECLPKSTEGYGFDLRHGDKTIHETMMKAKQVEICIDELSPFTNYECKAYFSNEAGRSKWSSVIKVKTKGAVPSCPKNFQFIGNDNGSLTFTWDRPEYMPGKLKAYRILFTWKPNYPSPNWCSSSGSRLFDEIEVDIPFSLPAVEPYSHYTATISAITEAGWGQTDTIEFDSPINPAGTLDH